LGVGGDVNAKGDDDWTPLHVVADIAAMHISFGRTPLHLAWCYDHLAVVNKLVSPNNINGTTSILGKRKSRGANIEVKDNDGDTPLHKASWFGHLPVVKALASGGANILAVNNKGRLHIDQSMDLRMSEVAKYLLQQLYATTRRLPFHDLLEDLTWINDPRSIGAPPLHAALHRRNMLGADLFGLSVLRLPSMLLVLVRFVEVLLQ
jgi:hypothetical protein